MNFRVNFLGFFRGVSRGHISSFFGSGMMRVLLQNPQIYGLHEAEKTGFAY